MRKFTLLGLLTFAIILSGCDKIAIQNTGSNYEGKLVIQGVGPEIAMEPTVDEGTLVLRGYFEDHSDHVFIDQGIWETYFGSENEYLPGNIVKLVGEVEPLDAAAGNRYYNVKSIEKLHLVSHPDENEIKEILDSYNYCEEDSDCTFISGECPFGCFVPFNKKFGDMPGDIMYNYFETHGATCVYDCLYMDTVVCENYKCVMYNEEGRGKNEEGQDIEEGQNIEEGENLGHDEELENGENEDEISQNEDEGIVRNNGDCCSCCKDLKPGESCIALCCPCDD